MPISSVEPQSISKSTNSASPLGTDYDFDVVIRSAILPGGDLWFPKRLPLEFLEAQRRRDPYLFSALYQNDPVPPEEQRFRPEWINYKDFKYIWQDSPRVRFKEDGSEVPVYVTTCVDPAISSEKYSDYTGITTVGCDPDDNWYVLSARRVRGGSNVVATECVREVEQFRPQRLGIETVAFQVVLRDVIRREFEDCGLVTSITELKSGTNKGKRVRIEALVPRFSEERVFLQKGLDGALETELREWRPWVEMAHDDLIDSLSHQEAISSPAPRAGLITPAIDIFDLPPHEREAYRTGKWGQTGRDPLTGY